MVFWPMQVFLPNSISISSAIFAGLTSVTNPETDTQTRPSQDMHNNNNNNTHICIVPYRHYFRGNVARGCASESEKPEETKPERKGMSLA